ncbi:MAG: phosphoribosylglycinamide formyltransferase [Chitinophagaceae bacterium]|nr:MAG: phosphoribosylglycinamide formyltransferase [Chitinophagaceae bacterium]
MGNLICNNSYAKKIIEHFQDRPDVVITTIVSNKPAAPVLEIARTAGISTLVIDKPTFENGETYIEQLKAAGVDLIVLAGFLWKVPPAFIRHWPGKILNIHPALLPAHGGKGMYGDKVHEAVLAAGDKESGISIHLVDELYDHGAVIFQARCPVDASDSPQTLAQKIHVLEHTHFPPVIDDFIKKQKGS